MKKFLIITAIVLIVLFVVLAAIIKMQSKFMKSPKLEMTEETVLEIDFSKGYPEIAGYDFSDLKLKRKRSFLDLVKAIEHAASNDKIVAMSYMLDGCSLSLIQMEELFPAIDKFKKAGKPIYAYTSSPDMRIYQLAATADSIFLAPAGNVYFMGFAIQPWFYSEAAKKLGVGFDVIQVGKFKGAAEMFTETGFTPALRESYTALLDGLFYGWIERTAALTGKSEDEIESLFDRGLFLPEEAVELDLVQGLKYPQQYRKDLLKLVDDDEDRIVSMNRYISGNKFYDGEDKIALIYAKGNIHMGKSEMSPFNQKYSIGSDTYIDIIDEAAEDEDIDAIVLRVDSPGGSALASDIILQSVIQAKSKKPVIVSMGGVAASGGYYISMAADSIFCDKNTITGSIGVVFLKPYADGLMDKLGVTVDTLIRGHLADEFALHKSMDPEGYEVFTRSILKTYDDFTSKAAEGRALELDSLLDLAEGRVWIGSDAMASGLVDRAGSLADAIDAAARMANIQPGNFSIETYPEEMSFFEMIFDSEGPMAKSFAGLPEPVRDLVDSYTEITQLFEEYESLYLCPVKVKFAR